MDDEQQRHARTGAMPTGKLRIPSIFSPSAADFHVTTRCSPSAKDAACGLTSLSRRAGEPALPPGGSVATYTSGGAVAVSPMNAAVLPSLLTENAPAKRVSSLRRDGVPAHREPASPRCR